MNFRSRYVRKNPEAQMLVLGGSSGDTPWMAAFELDVFFRDVPFFNYFAASGFSCFFIWLALRIRFPTDGRFNQLSSFLMIGNPDLLSKR